MTNAMTSRWMTLAFFLAAAVVFFIANRAAYQSYFSADDFDNLTWPTYVNNDVFYDGLLTLNFDQSNFRPIGDLYYRYLHRVFDLNFRAYVAVLQLFHALNVILLFLLLERFAFSRFAAGTGALFYAFHAAVLEAYWKPMYVFDLLCCTLCLLALLLYARGRWILALIPFWLAYKSKELAVMLPVALLAYELLLGQRRWKRLIPYFLISLNFGLQALWQNRTVALDNAYVLRFTPGVLWHSLAFYSSAVFFLRYAGLALLLLPVLVRDRRLYVGMIFMASAMVPLLALSRRSDSVYWYIPLIGLAIAFAAVAGRAPRWAIALFFIAWFPVNYHVLREKRRAILTLGNESRSYVQGLLDYARSVPRLKAVVYQGTPPHMQPWGVDGAMHVAFGPQVDAVWYLAPNAAEALAEVPMAIVGYYPVPQVVKGLLRTRNQAQSYIRFTDEIPLYQFGPGWNQELGKQAWIAQQAEVTLYRPAEAKELEIVALRESGEALVTVLEDTRSLGTQRLAQRAGQSLRWKLPTADSGNKKLTVQADSIAVQAIGYVSTP